MPNQAIIEENALIDRANAEIEQLESAGHTVTARRMAQGVELKIIRKAWGGESVSYRIIS